MEWEESVAGVEGEEGEFIFEDKEEHNALEDLDG